MKRYPASIIHLQKNAVQKISDGMHTVLKSLKFKQTTRTTEEDGEKAELSLLLVSI